MTADNATDHLNSLPPRTPSLASTARSRQPLPFLQRKLADVRFLDGLRTFIRTVRVPCITNVSAVIKIALVGAFGLLAVFAIIYAMVLIAAIAAGLSPITAANDFLMLAIVLGFFAVMIVLLYIMAK